jgi:hypothetical protein
MAKDFLRQFVDAVCDLHARGVQLPASWSRREARARQMERRSPREARKFRAACCKPGPPP